MLLGLVLCLPSASASVVFMNLCIYIYIYFEKFTFVILPLSELSLEGLALDLFA